MRLPVALAIVAALAAPAQATAAPADPWTAGALSAGAPVALFYASPLLGYYPALLAPAALGAGHAYAGDPGRGALFGVAGYAVWAGASAAAFREIAARRSPFEPSGLFGPDGRSLGDLGVALGIGALATVAFAGFAAWDAARTAERTNERERAEGARGGP